MLVDKRERLNTKKGEEALSEYFHMKGEIMAFVNKHVKVAERKEFTIPGYNKKYVPTKWTIDDERDVILFTYFRGDDYFPNLYKFALVVKDEVFCYEMSKCVKGNNITWKGGFGSKDNNIQYTEEADELLKEALKVYGACGSPFERLEDVDVIL
jgi:hypothetical protein